MNYDDAAWRNQAAVLAYFLFAEQFTWLGYVGGSLILAAVGVTVCKPSAPCAAKR